MDIEKLVYEMFKEELFTNLASLKSKIKRQFKDITAQQLNETSLRIYNYQLDKYGSLKKTKTYSPNNVSEGKRERTFMQKKSQIEIIKDGNASRARYHFNKNIERLYKSRGDNIE